MPFVETYCLQLAIMLNHRKGDDTLSDEGNEVIFRAVHKYIQQTKRFSSNI